MNLAWQREWQVVIKQASKASRSLHRALRALKACKCVCQHIFKYKELLLPCSSRCKPFYLDTSSKGFITPPRYWARHWRWRSYSRAAQITPTYTKIAGSRLLFPWSNAFVTRTHERHDLQLSSDLFFLKIVTDSKHKTGTYQSIKTKFSFRQRSRSVDLNDS